ncbi:MAG: hypothetical protein DRJ42_03545 [Deltaproteobacteria bacterium]|nr:MAG: hypothetical protein DRJ42_03545 [Deltaproteobacteria bacterium]
MDKRPTNERRSLLRDIRGTAMIETVIMLPVFILIWTGIIYIYQGYERKIGVMQQTRADAWHHATNNCDTSPSSGTSMSEADYEVDAVFSGLVSVLGHAYYPEPLRELDARRADSIEEPPLIGSDTVRIDYRMGLMCNEEPQELGEDIHYEAWLLFGLPEIL